MSTLLRSHLVELQIHFPSGAWEVHPFQESYPRIFSSPIYLSWRDSRKRYSWLAKGRPNSTSSIEGVSTPFGTYQQITLGWNTTGEQLSTKIDLSLATDKPIFLWRLVIENKSEEPIFLDDVTMLQTEGLLQNRPGSSSSIKEQDAYHGVRRGLGFDRSSSDLAFYTNGWQSWNYAGTLGIDDPYPRTKLGPLTLPMRENSGTPKPSRQGHYISNMFGVLGDRVSRVGLLVGFISQQQTFGIVEGWLDPTLPALRLLAQLDGVQIDPGESFQTDWAYLQWINLEDKQPLSDYFHLTSISNHARIQRRALSGWCSWYYAFEDVSQPFLMENLEWICAEKDRVPLDLFQVDDGYERNVGDWFDLKPSFPDGLQHISSKVREAGLISGIWLAPFVAKRGSRLGRERKDWILRNKMGLPVNPGFLWDSFPYVLDITHPEVLDHTRWVLKRLKEEMGFEYFKLDFLYAGALPGKRFNPKLTRAQALSQALQWMRDAVGEDVDLLGCGIPLGSGIGIFDHVRIGPDVAPRWKPAHWGIKGPLDREMGHPSTRNAILTTINRLPMHQSWWMNDPDCLLVRSNETYLTEAEVQTLASVIAMSGGAMIVSDHLPTLSEERVDWLTRLIPPLPHAARAMDWFDTPYPSKLMMDLESCIGSWHLICLLNWSDQTQDLRLDINDFGVQESPNYHVIDFWNQKYYRMSSTTLHFSRVPAHGVHMLCLRQANSSPQWLGDNMHISQGLFIRDWELQSNHVRCTVEPGRRGSGVIWMGMPEGITKIQIGAQEVDFLEIEAGIFTFRVEFEGTYTVRAFWD